MHVHASALASRALPAPEYPRPRNVRLAALIATDGRPKYLIAALAALPPNVLGGIISGRVIPTESAQARLAEVLGTTVADLFGQVTA
jgi:hypothetical protein